MGANSEVSLENNRKIAFVTLNKGQSLLVLKNYVYKCNKKTNTNKYWLCISDKWNMYVHIDINDKYLILLNNFEYKNSDK